MSRSSSSPLLLSLAAAGLALLPSAAPAQVDESKIESLRSRLQSLATTPQTSVIFSPPAARLFGGFYVDWEREERSGLCRCAGRDVE